MPTQDSIPTLSFDSILTQYRESLKWLDSLGVNYQHGRVCKYLRIFEEWNRSYKTATSEDAKNSYPAFIYSIQEMWDFISIYEAFKLTPTSELSGIITKLKDGVKGPENLFDETPKSTRARNFIFEAVMAAKTHKPTRHCSAILDAETDTGIRFEKSSVWVECKRVTTEKKIEKNVREASKQLQHAISKKVGSNHRGLVALDVSKILNNGDRIFVASDSTSLLYEIDLMMDRFIREHSHIWQKIITSKSPKILGVIIKYDFMASSDTEGLVSRCCQWAINPRNQISPRDSEFLHKLTAVLKDSD
ncbi:hypothetical protein [Amphritea sp.]|uniref:hypothetical protein n=1 Tax=Amphritea sp. TaxID=1872502 RepID=UPI003D0E3A7E